MTKNNNDNEWVYVRHIIGKPKAIVNKQSEKKKKNKQRKSTMFDYGGWLKIYFYVCLFLLKKVEFN